MAPRIEFTKFYNIINGQLCDSNNHTVGIDPATKGKLWAVPVATDYDVEDAVVSANKAFTTWSASSFEERRILLSSFRDIYFRYLDDFTQLLMRETGKPKATAEGEVHGVLELFDHHLELELPEEVLKDEEKVITTRYVPIGVVAAISPWNFPIFLSIGKIIPAVLTGCCIIVKPSPFTPYTALKVVELAQRVFPPGVVQVVGGSDNIGPVLVSHPSIHKISFTGSVNTGKRVMASAAATLKRVTLELGGNDATIILPDVDIEKVAPEVVTGCFINSGQVCVATKRVYVHASIYDGFLRAMKAATEKLTTGNPHDETVSHGPIQNEMQYDRIRTFFDDCDSKGYRFATGDRVVRDGKGYFITPTIVDNPPEDSMIVAQEQFGPIVPTLSWTEESDVIARANNSNTGLAACVWGSDVARAEKIARQLQAGSVFVNSWERTTPRAFFSGHKESGIGGGWGRNGLLSYCNAQVAHVYKN